MPKQRTDRRALINERGEAGDASSLQNASLPYIPTKVSIRRYDGSLHQTIITDQAYQF